MKNYLTEFIGPFFLLLTMGPCVIGGAVAAIVFKMQNPDD